MKKSQEQVREFMLNANQYIGNSPSIRDWSLVAFRLKLIEEEVDELKLALTPTYDLDTPIDTTEVYDALIDIIYVVLGAAVSFGMEIAPGWEEVHKSNMTKFIDGHRGEDGKWLKGPSYCPPNLEEIINEQKKNE
jgi:hypothetical protein